MKKKVLVLGQGYVGTHLCISKQNVYNVVPLTMERSCYHQVDKLIDIINRESPDYIINASGYTGKPNVDACESDKQKCWELNVNLPVNIASICSIYNIPFIHISSGCIYTGYDKMYTEADPPNFGMETNVSSWYSKTKHAAEKLLVNLNTFIFRIRMPFCGTNNSRNFLNKILKYDKLIVYENSMTSIPDFINYIWKFINRIELEKTIDTQPHEKELQPGIYNVCNPGSASIEDVVELFKQYGICNNNWEYVNISELELKANRSNCILDCSKIYKLNMALPPVIESLEKSISTLTKSLLWKTGLQGPSTGLQWQIK